MEDPPLVMLSNRGPLTYQATDGRLHATRGGGGLVSGLAPVVAGTGATWIAAALSEGDRVAARGGARTDEGCRVRLLDLDPDDFRRSYDVIGNETLWFLHHHLFDRTTTPTFDRTWRDAWAAYRRVNDAFAEAAAAEAPQGATVVVHDYHLALVPRRLAEQRPDVRIAHFSHTPFAGEEAIGILPDDVAHDIAEGMAAASCGFHTERWSAEFTSAAQRVLGRAPETFVAPLGPDPDDLARTMSSPACASALERLNEIVGDRQVLARVDRLEPSKNLLRGFAAFDALLEGEPVHRERVVFVASLYSSRGTLAAYAAYHDSVLALVHDINERWGTSSWQPIVVDLADDHPAAVALLRRYDVLLVNPVRDGMNLVAKEGPLCNERHGTLALSREAGAFAEMGGPAHEVNPFDVAGTAAVLHDALCEDEADKRQRSAGLRRLAARHSPATWLADVVAAAR